MAVYFIIENEDLESQRIKIGYSGNPGRRIKELQTGNSRKLALMGWVSGGDKAYESTLHEKYSTFRVQGEWFEIDADDVIYELKSSGIDGYIAIQSNANEFLGCDRDGVPEFIQPWEWADTELQEFCPQCGCSCGLQYNENYGAERCLNCGIVEFQHEEF